MPNNSLDFSLQYFGPSTEQGLYAVVNEAELPKLEGFLEAYRAFVRSGAGALPKMASSTLRPYLPYVDKPDWAVGGLQLDYHTLKTDGAEWAIADAIKHRLLYCQELSRSPLKFPERFHGCCHAAFLVGALWGSACSASILAMTGAISA